MAEERPESMLPRKGNRLSRNIGKVVLAAFGWRIDGRLPDAPKFVAVGAPHTSNWDFVFCMATILALGVEANWLGKHTLFTPPLGSLMRWLGGIPVDRSVSSGFVAQAIAAFQQRDRMILCLAPEGTRSAVPEWKTGFYHIAQGAQIPIVLCSLDYSRRVVGLGPAVKPSGDLEVEVASIRSFYRGIRGKHPN